MKIDPVDLKGRDTQGLLANIVVPRPIAFVSTIGTDGVFNAAPFSFFAGLYNKPMIIGFAISKNRDGRKKDTLVNIEAIKEFVINVVTEDLAAEMNQTSKNYPSDVDEFMETGLTSVVADMVKAPMVAESPINMECRLLQITEFGDEPRESNFIIGEVVRVHIKDELFVDDKMQFSELKAIGRLGGPLYCRTTDIFKMKRPD